MKRELSIFGIAVASCLIVPAFPAKSGVCFSEFRLIGNNDCYRAAIQVIISDPSDKVYEAWDKGRNVIVVPHVLPDDSVESFLSENPNC